MLRHSRMRRANWLKSHREIALGALDDGSSDAPVYPDDIPRDADGWPLAWTSDIRDRFFHPAGGPVDVWQILAGVDRDIASLNARLADADCAEGPAVAYTIRPFGAPDGETRTFWAQCVERHPVTDPQGNDFGESLTIYGAHAGHVYLYTSSAMVRLAADVTLAEEEGTSPPRVELLYAVGIMNAERCGSTGTYDGCSYGVAEIRAEPATGRFEMATAGVGIGFCGVQLRSDGSALRTTGSRDGGSQCSPASTLCVRADDLTSESECSALGAFELRALGRIAGGAATTQAASLYPEVPNVQLDGTPQDATGFGPSEPPTFAHLF